MATAESDRTAAAAAAAALWLRYGAVTGGSAAIVDGGEGCVRTHTNLRKRNTHKGAATQASTGVTPSPTRTLAPVSMGSR